MSRPTMQEVWMDCALAVARRSTCNRRVQVGCVVTSADLSTVYAVGYNGPSRGLPNDSCSGKPGKCECVHAEANALIKSPYDRGDLVMFNTLAPCERCARLILNSRVKLVFIKEMYRYDTGLKLLLEGGIRWETL